MALAIPKYAVAADDVATKLYARLSHALTDHYKIYQYLSTSDLPVGTLFYIQKERRSLLVFICDDSSPEKDVSQLGAKELVSDKADALRMLLRFQQSLFPEKLRSHADLLAPFIILFPNSVNADTRLHLKAQGVHIYGRKLLPQNHLRYW